MNDDKTPSSSASAPPKVRRWEHCVNCDPSFTCWDKASDCRKLPVGWPQFVSPPTARDWEEDPANDSDNGCYQNSCAVCKEPFIGNKRRVVCKLCATPNVDALREMVVWGFHGDEIPQYTQGSKGEHEMTEPITAEEANGLAKTIVDLRAAVRDLIVFAEACSHNLMCNVGSGESALDYDTYEPSEIALQAKAMLEKHRTVIKSTKAIP